MSRTEIQGNSERLRTSAWGRSGTLITTPATPNNRIVSLSKTFPHPGTYTVQFGLKAPNPNLSAVEAQALVTWGAGGNALTRRVSLVNGMSLSGTSDSIRVVMKDATSTGGDGVEYGVTALVTPGTRPTYGQPPTLVPAISTNPRLITPGNFADFDVPVDAGAISVSVIVGSTSGGGVLPSIPEQQASVEQLAPGIVGVLKKYDARMFEYVPLSPGCTTVRLRNKTAAITLYFAISFGIDG